MHFFHFKANAFNLSVKTDRIDNYILSTKTVPLKASAAKLTPGILSLRFTFRKFFPKAACCCSI